MNLGTRLFHYIIMIEIRVSMYFHNVILHIFSQIIWQ